MNDISNIFKYADTISLSIEEETALISKAQDGNEEATMRLITAYGPALRNAVSRFMKRLPVEERTEDKTEDAQMETLATFMDVLATHDPAKSPRLAGRIAQRLTHDLAEYARIDAAMTIPERTLSRFYGILRAADGDIEAATALAPEMGMSTYTFNDVRAVVRETLSLTLDDSDEEGREGDKMLMHPLHTEVRSEYDEVEDNVLIDVAFKAVDDEEHRIVSLSYGFTGTEDYAQGEPVPDGVIAGLVGSTRPTVQRKRGKAIEKMRKAVGVTVE